MQRVKLYGAPKRKCVKMASIGITKSVIGGVLKGGGGGEREGAREKKEGEGAFENKQNDARRRWK